MRKLTIVLTILLVALTVQGQEPRTAQEYLERGIASVRNGNLAGALADFDKAIELEPNVAIHYINRGNTLMIMERDLDKALADFDKAIELGFRGPDIYKSRGLVRYYRNNFAGAIAEYDKAIESGTRDAQVYGLRGLAWLWLSKDKEAEKDFQRCFEMDVSLRESYEKTINDIQQKRASEAFRALPNATNDESLTRLKKELEEAEKSGKRDLKVGSSLNNLAEFYSRTGSTVEAGQLFARALYVAKEIENKGLEATVLNNLGLLRRTQARYDEALSYLQSALSIREKIYEPDDPKVAITLDNLGLVYGHKKEYGKAEELMKRALAVLEKKRGMSDGDVMITTRNLASLYNAQGRHTDAVAVYQRQLDLLEKEFGADFPRFTGPLSELITLFEKKGDHQQAEALLRRYLEKDSSPAYPDKVMMLTHLGDRLMSQIKYAEAEQCFRLALDFIDKGLGGKRPLEAILSMSRYARLLHKTGRDSEVIKLQERSSKLAPDMKSLRAP
jgi:tetratricopeptide (TPR) repeat protein